MRWFLVVDAAAVFAGWWLFGRGWSLWWTLLVAATMLLPLWAFDRYRQVEKRDRVLACVMWLGAVWAGFLMSTGAAFLLRPSGLSASSLAGISFVLAAAVLLTFWFEKRRKKEWLCRAEPLNGAYIVFKRLFDICFAVVALALFLPIFVLIAAVVKLTSKGPAFYLQPRVGRGGEIFPMVKFRSMVANAEKLLESDPRLLQRYREDFKLRDDPRVTPLGRLLRKSSLDETPQLFNVLVGQMSIVGPRPVRPQELTKHKLWTNRYLALRPGITGMWQVNGRNDLPYWKRVVYNVYYCKHLSLWLDLKILAKTILVVVKREGVV